MVELFENGTNRTVAPDSVMRCTVTATGKKAYIEDRPKAQMPISMYGSSRERIICFRSH